MKFQMTFWTAMGALMITTGGLTASMARADTVQVPVQRAFVPASGYDDNDNVQIRVEGTLPDACYVLGDRSVNRSADGKTFTILQSAWRRENGACGTGDLLTETTFSVDVSLGQLTAGDYRITQTSDDGKLTYVPFNVAPARLSTTDDYNYANVTQISVSDIVQRGKDVAVTLSGLYSSSCMTISQPISVQQVGDVFVVKPIEVQKPGVNCHTMILRLFKDTIHLGSPSPGEYLVHVRARNGRAVEQTFQVLDIQDPPALH